MINQNNCLKPLPTSCTFLFCRQQGAVLLTGLIMLLILTLIGVSGLSSVTMEEKMVSNIQNQNRAFQGAEAALSFCEDYIKSNNLSVLQVGTGDVVNINKYTNDYSSASWWSDSSFWRTKGAEFSESGQNLASNPRCVAEFIGKGGGAKEDKDKVEAPGVRHIYRLTASSQGYDATATAVVESIYARY